MRYYLKHLGRLILLRPLQPLVIILVLTLSFTVQFVSVAAARGIERDNELQYEAAGGEVVIVTPPSDAALPLVFDSAVRKAYPDAAVTGVISMPLLAGQDVVSGYAVDWQTANGVFPQSFAQCLSLTEAERADALFITQSYAEKHGLSYGDVVSFRLYGYDLAFTVRGFFDTPILGDGDVCCDVTSTLRAYLQAAGAQYAFLADASLSGTYGRMYVKSSSLPVQDPAAALRDLYPDAIVQVHAQASVDNGFNVFKVIPAAMVFFTFVIALIVSVSCLWCLSKQRAAYAYLFSLVGFPPRRALACRILEMIFYALPAAGLGVCLSVPIGRLLFSQMELSFVTFGITLQAALPAAASLCCIAVLSPIVAEVTAPVRARTLPTLRYAAAFGAVTVLFAVLSFCLSVKLRFYAAVPAVIFLFLGVYFVAKPCVVALSKRLGSIGKKKRNVPCRLAVKNGARVGELANATRLLAVLLVAVSCLGFLAIASHKMVTLNDSVLVGDYIISGSETILSQLQPKIQTREEVASAYLVRVWDGETVDGGNRAFFLGITDTAVLGYDFGGDVTLPAPGETFVASFVAQSRYLACGETFCVTNGTETLSLLLTDTIASSMPEFITHYDTLEGAATYLTVSCTPGVDAASLFDALCSVTAGMTVEILPTHSLFSTYVRENMRYVFFEDVMIVMLSLFGLVGIGNNLCESIRSRREEFASLHICGMRRSAVAAMVLYENLFVIIMALLLALPAVLLAIPVTNAGLSTYSSNCIQILLDAMRLHV